MDFAVVRERDGGVTGDGWHYRVWQGATGRFVAECKRTPFLSLAPPEGSAMDEPGPVWFEFGETPESALANLQGSHRDEAVH